MGDFSFLGISEEPIERREDYHVAEVDDLFRNRYYVPCIKERYVYNAQFYHRYGDQVFLVMKHPTSLYFRGTISVQCLAGSVDVNGFLITPQQEKSYKLFSLCSHSALCITTNDLKLDLQTDLEPVLKLNGAGKLRRIFKNLPHISCVLLISRCSLPGFDRLSGDLKSALLPERHTYKGFIHYNETETWTNCVFDVPSGDRIKEKLVFSSDFVEFGNELLTTNGGVRLAVCGGKGVGKSTGLRYIVNKLLTVRKSVMVIDFDIGQPEFTMPGCVSVVLVTKPLLGPSYTHVQEPLRSIFLGYVDVDRIIDKFEQSINEIERFCYENYELSELSWIVNTMGYIKGVGLVLLHNIVNRFHLSHVVQFYNPSDRTENGYGPNNLLSFLPGAKYNFKAFPMRTSNSRFAISPLICRNLLSSFYLVRNEKKLSLQKVFSINSGYSGPGIMAVYECISGKSRDPIIGEIVAICQPYEYSSMKECVGFGKVASCSDEYIVLLTSLSAEVLANDSYMIVGNLKLSHTTHRDIVYELDKNQRARDWHRRCVTLIKGTSTTCPALFSSSS